MDYDERVLKLSRFVRQVIDESGLKLHPWHRRYGIGRDGKALISATTLRNLVNASNAYPDGRTFEALSVMLSKSTGKDISALKLIELCEPTAEDESGYFDQPIDDSPTRADLIVRQYLALPYYERGRIAPSLLRTIADDDEYSVLSDAEQVAWLVRQEKSRQGLGTAAFAKDFVGVPVEVVEAILKKEPTRLVKAQFLALTSRVRDINGKLLLSEEEARRSLFARVLAPQLFIDIEENR